MTKSKKPLIYSLLFLGIIILGGLIYFIATPTQQLMIPSTCVAQTSSPGIGLFECSTSASICTGTIKLECNTQTTVTIPANPYIAFRTNANIKGVSNFKDLYHNMWIAVDLNAQDDAHSLTPFKWIDCLYVTNEAVVGYQTYKCFQASHGSGGSFSCQGTPILNSNGLPLSTPDGKRLYKTGDSILIYSDDCKTRHVFTPDLNNAYAVLTPTTVSSYSLNNQEISAGGMSQGSSTTSYTCTESSSGNVVKTLTCSSSSPCTKSESFQLMPGQKIIWNGKIDSVTIKNMNSECTRDMPNPSDPQSYYQCIINSYGCGAKASNPTSCPTGTAFMANEAICKLPFTFTVSTDKPTYETGSQIIATPKLTNTNLLNGFAGQVCAYKLSGEIVTCKAFTTGSNGMATVTLDAINNVGTYEIVSSIKHQLVGYSQMYSNKVNVNFADSLFLRMYANTPQNTGQIEVFAVVSDSSGQPHEGFFDFAGSICGTTDITASIQQPRFQTNQEDGALYKILVNIGSPCDLTVKAKVMDSSGYTSKSAIQSVSVRRASLIIEQINEESIQNEKEGRYTYQFFVFNEDREPIEPSTIGVSVQERGGCYTGKTCTARGSEFYGINIPAITVTKVDTGKYQFTHTWNEGLNILTISAEDAYLGLARNEYKSNVLLLKGDEEPEEDELIIPPENYCELYPTDPGCIEDYCTSHPNDIGCVEDYCTLHPTDSECANDFCTLHPTDAGCVEDFCTLHPTDIVCVDANDYCTLYPNDDKCKPSTFPTELVIGIAVGVLSLAIFFVIVFKKRGKKRRK